MKKQRNKIVGGWLAAVVSLLFVSACRAPTPQAGRYQWTIVTHENKGELICVIDTHTGDVSEWEKVAQVWRFKESVALPDFEALRREKAKLEEQAKRAHEKRDALVKSYAQMPLEQQVVWAKEIRIIRRISNPRMGADHPAFQGLKKINGFELVHLLKYKRLVASAVGRPLPPYTATDEDLVVQFEGMTEDGYHIVFGLSRTPIESERIFPAPATIIDDVKAEIKRLEKKQEEAHAENH